MRIEAAMRETRKLHQIGHAHAVGTALPKCTGSMFDDPVPGLQAMPLHVAHGRLSSILISPFLREWTNLAEEGPCRAVLSIEVPQFVGDGRRLDKELVRRVRQT